MTDGQLQTRRPPGGEKRAITPPIKEEWGALGCLGMSGAWCYIIYRIDGDAHRFDWESEPGFITLLEGEGLTQ